MARDVLDFGTGFHRFHRNGFVNYQLNRSHALGFVAPAEAEEAARFIRRIQDAAAQLEIRSRRAATGQRGHAATGFARLSEFFTDPHSPERIERYRCFRDLFDATFPGVAAGRQLVPYGGAHLPAYVLPAPEGSAAGTVLVHGGFDSVIEEFLGIWQRIAAAGFDVVAFDGPGREEREPSRA